MMRGAWPISYSQLPNRETRDIPNYRLHTLESSSSRLATKGHAAKSGNHSFGFRISGRFFLLFPFFTRPRAETQRAVKMSMGTCRGRLNSLAAFSSGIPFYIANDKGAHMFKPIPPYHHAIEGGILEKPEGSNAFSGRRSLYVIQKTKTTFPSTENNLNLHYLRVN